MLLSAPSSFVDKWRKERLRHSEQAAHVDALAIALTRLEIVLFYDWINRGDARQRALRSDLVSLCICPHLLPCKHPSAAWVAQEHGVSQEYAGRLRRDFVRQFADYIQLRGQRAAGLPISRQTMRQPNHRCSSRKMADR